MALLGIAYWSMAWAQPPEGAVAARVARVVDGDTVLLTNGEYVRYMGIDTPEEGEPFYWAAKRLNWKLVWRKTVYLEISPEHRDGYGRLLAYVWVKKDGKWLLVNEELLRAGLARLLVIWPDQYYHRLLVALTQAQVRKRGLWYKYKEPLALAEVEAKPFAYVTEAITVVFKVGAVERGREGMVVRAEGSRYGFHLVVDEGVWKGLGLTPEKLVGKELRVTGELHWDYLPRGPYIPVLLPEQVEILGF